LALVSQSFYTETDSLFEQVASERPLRLKFSSGMLASQLSVTELAGTLAASPGPPVGALREAEEAEVRRRVLMGRVSLLRVDRLLREVIATPACTASLGADMAELLSAELEEVRLTSTCSLVTHFLIQSEKSPCVEQECLQLGTEESLLAAMGVS
jgi:hypothetical protein